MGTKRNIFNIIPLVLYLKLSIPGATTNNYYTFFLRLQHKLVLLSHANLGAINITVDLYVDPIILVL